MATLRDIQRRIRSVQSTQKITRAMKLVAAAKLRRAQERALAARPYAGKMAELLGNLVTGADGTGSCTVTPDAVAQSGTVTVTFAGTAEFAPASADGTVGIAPSASATSLTGPATSLFSVPAVFVATVAPTDGGAVAFTAGGVPIQGCEAAPVTVAGGSGQATCTTSALGVGAHEIAAGFTATANYLPSTAEPLTISVAVAPTSLMCE